MRAVVVANCWRGVHLERIEDADGVGLGGQLADVPLAYPAEAGSFVGGFQLSPGDLAPEDQGDDTASHVLIGTGQNERLNLKPDFLPGLAAAKCGTLVGRR